MGQVLSRTTGRVLGSRKPRPPPLPPADLSRNAECRPPPPQDGVFSVQDRLGVTSPEDTSKMDIKNNVLLEEHDPEFDSMLEKMAGTIKSQPAGKPEMGEAFNVQNYNRPLPKARSSKEQSGGHGQKPGHHPGTVTIAQLQEIMLLHQGKSADHKGAMEIQDIAKKYGVDVCQVEKIIQFVSLPREDKK